MKNKDAMPILYYLQLEITANFMTSGSMHVVVVHEDDGSDQLEQKSNSFAYDHSTALKMLYVLFLSAQLKTKKH